ncbi:abc transporter transmembrane region domain-containing protein, partial [Cystoisospora suis]
MIRKPSILILDEATSALDTVSERVVQEALDKLIEHTRATTIIVAHRLSTIRNADQIIVLDASKTESSQVVQIGNHHTLMQDKDGLYYQLVQSQIMSVETEAKVKGDDPPTVYENDLTGDSIRDQISKHLSVLSSRKSASSSVLANSGTLVMHAESSSHGQSLHPSSTHGKTGRSVVHPASTVKEEEKPLAPAYSRGREYEGEGIFKKMRRRLSTFLQIRTLSYLKPWTLLCLVALIAAVCAGALYPLFGVIFSKFTKVYFYPDPHKIRHD